MATSSFPISSPIEISEISGAPGIIYLSTGSSSVVIKAPAVLPGNVDFTLPAITGTTGQVLEKTGTDSSTWSNLNLTSAGGTHSLIVDGSGLNLSLKGISIGIGLTLTPGANDVTIANSSPASSITFVSSGGTFSIANDIVGPTFSARGLTAGTGIGITSDAAALTITNASPASSITFVSSGGTFSIANDIVGPTFSSRGLTAGTGIGITSDAAALTITNSSPASSISLTSAGGTQTLLKSAVNPFTTRGLTAGAGVTLTGGLNDIIIANSSPASSVTFVSSGGTFSIANDIVGPTFSSRGLTAGTGIGITSDAAALTITNSSPASSISLAYPGVDNSMIVSGTAPNLTTKGLIAGTGITLTPGINDITVNASVRSYGYMAGSNDSPSGYSTVSVTTSYSNVNKLNVVSGTGNVNFTAVDQESLRYQSSGLVTRDFLVTATINVIIGPGRWANAYLSRPDGSNIDPLGINNVVVEGNAVTSIIQLSGIYKDWVPGQRVLIRWRSNASHTFQLSNYTINAVQLDSF
jgi:hypothetical protein